MTLSLIFWVFRPCSISGCYAPRGANAPQGAEHRIAPGERLKGANPGIGDEKKVAPWKGATLNIHISAMIKTKYNIIYVI